MDRRIFILPIVSIILVMVLLTRPDITGFMTAAPAGPEVSEISANISVTIGDKGFIPDGSTVTVYLDDRSSSMDFGEFVKRTGTGGSRIYGEIDKIDYKGDGYGGFYSYSLPISEFGLDAVVGHGEHRLVIKVSYGNLTISNSSETKVV